MKYNSKRSELCLVMRPTDRVMDEHRRVQVLPGKKAEFYQFRYETEDPEMIEFLHNHPLRGSKFFEITPTDEIIVQEAKKAVPKIATGAISSATAIDRGEAEQPTRPDQTTSISPELIKVIDDRVNAALEQIVSLLKKDAHKEEKKEMKASQIMSGKSTKTFTCPYCGDPFTSGFKVGGHKKICTKRPKSMI